MEKKERKDVAEESCTYITDKRQLTVGFQGEFLNLNLARVHMCACVCVKFLVGECMCYACITQCIHEGQTITS